MSVPLSLFHLLNFRMSGNSLEVITISFSPIPLASANETGISHRYVQWQDKRAHYAGAGPATASAQGLLRILSNLLLFLPSTDAVALEGCVRADSR